MPCCTQPAQLLRVLLQPATHAFASAAVLSALTHAGMGHTNPSPSVPVSHSPPLPVLTRTPVQRHIPIRSVHRRNQPAARSISHLSRSPTSTATPTTRRQPTATTSTPLSSPSLHKTPSQQTLQLLHTAPSLTQPLTHPPNHCSTAAPLILRTPQQRPHRCILSPCR